MFDEPNESPKERVLDPVRQAKQKADEFRMHAEIFAVFEGSRKFDAQVVPGLHPDLAREVQKGMVRLEKSKAPESPILPPASAGEAAALLDLPRSREMSTNDYHIHRRPGEVMMVRWLAGDEVEAFYDRMQAHFDVALEGYREDEREQHGWKQDEKMLAYLKALEGIEVKTAERYLREVIRKHKLWVLSTVTADEMDILHLCETVMGVAAAEVVGEAAAPPEAPDERDRAWFFRLFSLRGMKEGEERMCFFAYLQKTEDTFDGDW